MDNEKEKNENQEVTPAWATKLQESLDSLSSHLSEALNPPQQQEETDPTAPQEIPVPEPPQQETPEVEQLPQEEETPKKKRKRSLSFWL